MDLSVKRSLTQWGKTMDRTAFIFVLLIMTLFLFGIVPIEKEDPVIDIEVRTYEARVRFDVEENLLILCDIADTVNERTKGLMEVRSLGARIGMLFVYDEPENVTFWMKGTYIDLDIIFISEELKVMNVHEAVAGAGKMDNELEFYSSESPVAFVLEVNQGLSNEFGIGPGTSLDIVL